jgi:hypothetical protein
LVGFHHQLENDQNLAAYGEGINWPLKKKHYMYAYLLNKEISAFFLVQKFEIKLL